MKRIKNFNVPESWNDITISQLKKLKEINETQTIETHFQILSIFNPNENIMVADFQTVLSAVNAIYSVFATTPTATPNDGTYTLKENTYRLMKVEELDFQTFLDFQNLASVNGDDWERIKNLGLIVSLLTADRGDKDIKAFGEEIENSIDVVTATSLLVFFSDKLTCYIADSPHFSEAMQKMMNEKAQNLTTV